MIAVRRTKRVVKTAVRLLAVMAVAARPVAIPLRQIRSLIRNRTLVVIPPAETLAETLVAMTTSPTSK